MWLTEADRMLKLVYLRLVEDILNDNPPPTIEEIMLEMAEDETEQ